jgi:hypothetical protein
VERANDPARGAEENEPLKWSIASGTEVWSMFADLDVRDEDICSTPLAWASRRWQEGIVALLRQHGAG